MLPSTDTMDAPILSLVSLLLAITSIAFSQPVRSFESDEYAKERDCTLLIRASHAPNFNWTGTIALSLAECLIQTKPKHDTCVFYTADSRLNAIRYASETDKSTIYDAYAPHHFNASIEPMRRWKRDGHQRDVFRVTSKAYALACSGEASVVMPENVEACPGSIWVTDEYEVIRKGESRIELPVWRVSWTKDKAEGLWRWVVKVLGGVEKRDVVADGQKVIWGAAVGVRDKVDRQLDEWRREWRLDEQEVESDPWAVLQPCFVFSGPRW